MCDKLSHSLIVWNDTSAVLVLIESKINFYWRSDGGGVPLVRPIQFGNLEPSP